MNELFEYYISRSFVSPDYRERLLEKHIRSVLQRKKIGARFVSKTFTDGLYTARFPFVEVDGGNATSVIKPIFLGQSDPTRILDHSNKWIFTVQRLREVLPKRVRFAVEGPTESELRSRAFDESLEAFKRSNITVFNALDESLL